MEEPSSLTLSSKSSAAELPIDLAILVYYLVNQKMDPKILSDSLGFWRRIRNNSSA
jgi:hypothetical protein